MFRRIALLMFLAAFAAVVPPSAVAGAAALHWPVEGEVITPYRNGSDPYAGGMHRGIDIAAAAGSRVGAATAGTVTFAGRLGDGALDVTVRSADGRYLVSHMHLGSVAVRRGSRVSAGERLGTAGNSGRPSSSRPHLHLGVRIAATGAYVDPLPMLPPVGQGAPPDRPGVDAAAGTLGAPVAGERAGNQNSGNQRSRMQRSARVGRPLRQTLRAREVQHGRSHGSRPVTALQNDATVTAPRAGDNAGRTNARSAHARSASARSAAARATLGNGVAAPGLSQRTRSARQPRSTERGQSRDSLKVTASAPSIAEESQGAATEVADLRPRGRRVSSGGRSERALRSIALLCVALVVGIALWRRRLPHSPTAQSRSTPRTAPNTASSSVPGRGDMTEGHREGPRAARRSPV